MSKGFFFAFTKSLRIFLNYFLGFHTTDAHDYEYSKIKLSVLLFEISFYYQNFEGTGVLLNYLKKFHSLVKTRNHEFIEANKESDSKDPDKPAKEKLPARLPLYNSIIYGSETYHNSSQVEYNYNKSELDILLIFMKIFYLILMEDKNLSENYLNLVTTLTNKFVADLVLHNPKTLRVYPNEESDPKKKMAVTESGYSEKLGKRISAHIKLLIQFLMATHHFYEKNFAACISVLSQKCFLSKGKKKETEKLSKGKYKFFYLNAIGCCHFHMDKPSLAIQYFQKATAECDLMQATTKDAKEKPNKKDKPNTAYPAHSNPIKYNKNRREHPFQYKLP